MHPALSIIVFTTLSGLGYGLAAVLGLGLLDPAAIATKIAHFIALSMISGGLLSSTLHLGNPQRAWRAFSQWRSSWLSREGVLAILTFIPLCVSAWLSIFEDRHLLLPGIAGSLLSIATVFCTAMIYASIKSIDAWHTPLTPLCYLLFSTAGGALLGLFFAAVGDGPVMSLAIAAGLLLVCAWLAKLAWWHRLLNSRPRSTPESATGLGPIGKVRLFESPHTLDNYLTREMGFRVARRHARKLKAIAIGAGCGVPLVCLLVAVVAGKGAGITAAALAVIGYGVGLLVERWLFFAEARHAVMNYYEG
jgi:DMSO reductase anchor subunit